MPKLDKTPSGQWTCEECTHSKEKTDSGKPVHKKKVPKLSTSAAASPSKPTSSTEKQEDTPKKRGRRRKSGQQLNPSQSQLEEGIPAFFSG